MKRVERRSLSSQSYSPDQINDELAIDEESGAPKRRSSRASLLRSKPVPSRVSPGDPEGMDAGINDRSSYSADYDAHVAAKRERSSGFDSSDPVALRGSRRASLPSHEDEVSNDDYCEYDPGFEIRYGNKVFGKVGMQLSHGRKGAVYVIKRPDGKSFVLKTLREDLWTESKRVATIKKLAVEAAISFALGRSALTDTVS
jgi:hypothetical protein